jgi:hypothetical protein
MVEISPSKLQEMISQIHFSNDGDDHEKKYGPVFEEHFPNLELFWRKFVVPTSQRIVRSDQSELRIARRNEVEDAVWDVTFLHYSMFLHLVYAYEHLKLPTMSSFGDVYAHLVSASDLAQDFLIKIYNLILECRGTQSHIMKELTREEFLGYAGEWYDDRYANAHQHYLAKGKWASIKIPARESFLAEYIGATEGWKDFCQFDMSIRTYRNFLIHSVAIGEVLLQGELIVLVPRRQRIQAYKTLRQVSEAAQSYGRLMADFTPKEKQVNEDFLEMQNHLNGLWEKPLSDLEHLFLQEHNEKLLEKYRIRFIPQ